MSGETGVIVAVWVLVIFLLVLMGAFIWMLVIINKIFREK